LKVPPVSWTKSIFVRMLAMFLAIMVPIYVLSFNLYNWGLNAAKGEVEKTAVSQAAFYLQGLEREIERIRILQYDCLNDDNLDRLTWRSEALDAYTTLEKVKLLRSRLVSIQNSSDYVRDVRVHISPITRTISAASGLADLDLAAFRILRVPTGLTGAQILHHEGRMCMSTLKANNALNAASQSMVEVELAPETFGKALAQFNTQPGSGACLADLASGRVLASSTEQARDSVCNTFLAQARAMPEDGVRYARDGEHGYFLLRVHSDYLNMALVRAIPDRLMLEPLRLFRAWVWIFGFVALAVILVYSAFAYRSMHKPLQALVSAFQRVEEGDLDVVIAHDPHNEFGYLYRRFNAMTGKLKTSIEQVYLQRILVQRAELKQLQSQIDPHFLYNSFFILNTMARLGDLDNLTDFTRQLSDYFRFIARNASETIPLAREAEHAEAYARIQAMRFSRRLHVEFGTLPEGTADIIVPRLILQPIIENAFKHSLERRERDGLLRVGFQLEDGWLRLVVEDNGEELDDARILALAAQVAAEEENAEVTGLMNIHRRVRLYYGKESGLRIDRSPLGGLRAVIAIRQACISGKASEKNDSGPAVPIADEGIPESLDAFDMKGGRADVPPVDRG